MRKTRSTVRSVFAAALAVIMLLSNVIGIVSVSAADPALDVPAFGNGDAKAYACAEGKSVGQRICLGGDFSGFSIKLSNYRQSGVSATVSIYKWNGNYSKTVSGKALVTKTFTDFKNNDFCAVEFSDAPLKAGEYLFLVTATKGKVGVWSHTERTVSFGCTYENGNEQSTDLDIIISFAASVPDEPFIDVVGEVIVYEDLYAYDRLESRSDYHITEGEIVGQRIKVTRVISGFAMCIPTYVTKDSSVTLSAYEWKGDYDSTISADPIASKRFENCGDGAMNWVEFDKAYPAGEYFFAAHDIDGDIGVYKHKDNDVSLGIAYVNGLVYSYDHEIKIRMATGDGAPFEKIELYKDITDGENQAPPEYKIPEDSYINKVQPSTWVFTDGLGRESLTYDDVGAVKSDKVMAMFFWDWHDDYIGKQPMNIQSVMDKYPEAKTDYDHPAWPEDKLHTHKFFWNEPVYGYYGTSDSWVLRRQAELLANAGVDTVFMDNSNDTRVFANGYTAVFEAWEAAMEGGVNSPKVSFHLPMWGETEEAHISFTKSQMEQLYLNLYQPERHQKLWFYYEGKPMLIAYGNHLDTTDIFQNEIKNFFTFRSGMASYFDADEKQRPDPLDRIGTWGWSSAYPQAYYHRDAAAVEAGIVEEISVSVAENYDYIGRNMTAMNGTNVAGRSFSMKKPRRYMQEGAEASKWGYNFEAQWNYALNLDPNVIFVTGWNEWTVRPLPEWCGVEFGCADQFDDEYSRDIEPTKGALKDYYYYQLVNFSRKFQGAEPIPTPSHKATIDLSAGQDQWAAVQPYFGAYKGNTGDREAVGSGNVTYVEYSGRNDIIGAQIARDDEFVYFNVECNEDITPYTDKLWMNLYIDTDQENKGWETFDFVVNKTAASEKTSVLEKFTEGYASEKVADVEYTVDGKFMTVKIAKSDLGLTGDDYTINFAWTDNVHDADDTGAVAGDKVVYSEFSGDIMDFYVSGDVAPGARFKFSYISNEENANKVEDETTDTTEDTTDAATEDTTEVTTDATTDGDTTAEADGGCKSSVALSAIAVITAIGAAVVLKKRD